MAGDTPEGQLRVTSKALNGAGGTTGQRIALVGLAVTWAASWIADASAASTYLYIEPTDEAVAAAARAAPRGVAASVVMLVAALAIAAVARRRWALVLVCPPILTGYLFLFGTSSHGAPLVVLLVSSLLVFAVGVGRLVARSVSVRGQPGTR